MTTDAKKIDVNNASKKKYIYLEVMRIIAIFFVIFNHTKYDGFCLFIKQEPESIRFWVYLFMSVLCKFAVPLFFTISGAIMLNKEDESLRVLWKKRIGRIFIILIVFSIIYYLSKNISNIRIDRFFIELYSITTRTHLWYLYAYIAFLIGLPFLKSLVKNLNNKYFYYMIGIFIFFNAILPIGEYLVSYGKYQINSNLKVSWILSIIVFYPCIGYFLQNRIQITNKHKTIPILFGINILGICITCLMTYYKGKVTGEFSPEDSQAFHDCFSCINCISVFATIKYLVEKIKINEWIEKIIYSIGECTLGIYLIHPLIKDSTFMKRFLEIMVNAKINHMIVTLIWCLCVLLITYGITYILRKIPVVKKLVGSK